MMIRAVIFDWGGVLVRTADGSLREAWERRLGLALGQSAAIVFGAETNYDVQTGRVSDEEHWAWIRQRLALNQQELADFRRDFFARDAVDVELLAYIDRLRARYTVGLLSNASSNARRLLSETYGSMLDHFDSVTISSEEGVMKPDARIYEIALARAGVPRAEEAIFVDDVLENVLAARRLGMAGVHFVDPTAARAELAGLTGVS
jgi:epoxide hydrolase-like predicted phosphatase